ncbi:LysR substrate-binding domain-containing protein [Brevibacillus centrosporus]|uniref:LysR substrate-binding domain-containing protein n=1 Tax=Brevibacillus centrosporus TaxID=54910 RepID=UPI003824641F
MLLNREVDICLISTFDPHPQIHWHPLLDEELFLYVPAKHGYAGRTSIALKQLSEDGFIGIRKGLGMREAIDGFCREAGFTPQIKFEGEDIPSIAALVSSGLGVTIIPAFQGIRYHQRRNCFPTM